MIINADPPSTGHCLLLLLPLPVLSQTLTWSPNVQFVELFKAARCRDEPAVHIALTGIPQSNITSHILTCKNHRGMCSCKKKKKQPKKTSLGATRKSNRRAKCNVSLYSWQHLPKEKLVPQISLYHIDSSSHGQARLWWQCADYFGLLGRITSPLLRLWKVSGSKMALDILRHSYCPSGKRRLLFCRLEPKMSAEMPKPEILPSHERTSLLKSWNIDCYRHPLYLICPF